MLARIVLASLCVGLVSATVICQDGALCGEQSTCCLTEGGYGCCSGLSAVCCSDQLHCCPAGYHCSNAAHSCVKDGLPWYRLPWLKHVPAKEPVPTLFEFFSPEFDSNGVLERPSEVGVVYCDNTYFCNDYSVCCVTRSGNWSCCPHTNGRCCRDGIHCCPFGSYCDRTSMKCLRGDQHTAATPQLPAFRSDDYQLSLPELGSRTIQRRPSDDHVEKCDEDYFCRYGQTCCLTPVGTWTCCKYSRGHCCRDGYHCCASGYVCDSSSYNCLNMTGDLATNAAPQLPALRYEDYKDPCCLSEAGCCQVGFHCDRDLRACVGDFAGPVPSATLIQAPVDGSVALSGVMHCRGRFYCPTGNSCCQSLTGEWGCCPYRQGQCCLDGKHCCGYKWTCDVTSKSCFRGDTSIASASMREIQQL